MEVELALSCTFCHMSLLLFPLPQFFASWPSSNAYRTLFRFLSLKGRDKKHNTKLQYAIFAYGRIIYVACTICTVKSSNYVHLMNNSSKSLAYVMENRLPVTNDSFFTHLFPRSCPFHNINKQLY